jgi:transcriptional regulator with XRE-family HTH domain
MAKKFLNSLAWVKVMPRSTEAYALNQEIVDRIRYHKTRKGLTSDDIGRRARLSRRTVQSLLDNEYNVALYQLGPLYDGFGRDIDVLGDLICAHDLGVVLSTTAPRGADHESAILQALGLTGQVGRLADLIRQVWADNRVTPAELVEIERVLDHLCQSAESLRYQARKAAGVSER